MVSMLPVLIKNRSLRSSPFSTTNLFCPLEIPQTSRSVQHQPETRMALAANSCMSHAEDLAGNRLPTKAHKLIGSSNAAGTCMHCMRGARLEANTFAVATREARPVSAYITLATVKHVSSLLRLWLGAQRGSGEGCLSFIMRTLLRTSVRPVYISCHDILFGRTILYTTPALINVACHQAHLLQLQSWPAPSQEHLLLLRMMVAGIRTRTA